MNIVGAILAISALIVVHEFGHFCVARWCGMRVERFSIGFGPAILGWRSKGGTLFQIAPIPFGGFVEIKGMNIAEDVDPDDHAAYPNRPAWQRFATIFAGPATNYLFAIVLAFALFATAGMQSAERWFGVDKVEDGYDAQTKLVPDDRILAVDGTPVWINGPNGEQMSLLEVMRKKQPVWSDDSMPPKGTTGTPVVLTIQRDGKQLQIPVTPKFDDSKDSKGRPLGFRLGIKLREQFDRYDVGIPSALGHAIAYPVTQTKEIAVGLYQVVTGQVKGEVKGPVGMGDMISQAFSAGWVTAMTLMMMLNVYLGLFNLLPLPALDGGRLVFLGYEMATRRRANPRIEATVHMVGILILAVIMVLVTFKDCANL